MKAFSFAAGAWLAVAVISLLYFVAGEKQLLMEFVAMVLIPGSLLVVAVGADPD